MSVFKISLIATIFAFSLVTGCGVSAKNTATDSPTATKSVEKEKTSSVNEKMKTSAQSIEITANSPAEVVKTFYQSLREKKFREALLLTNLNVAVETLTPEDLEELRPDFEALATEIPAEISINGEQIAGNTATVFVNMPDFETGKMKMENVTLIKEKDSWVISWADAATVSQAKKEGKNYFFNLRMEVRHGEAEAMLERISKAQFVYFAQNGVYGELSALVEKGFLPADIQTPQSTGYIFNVKVSGDKKKYSATAEPEKYGKTGKLSYFLDFDGKKSQIKSSDNKGLAIKK